MLDDMSKGTMNNALNLNELEMVVGGVTSAERIVATGIVVGALENEICEVDIGNGTIVKASRSGQLRMNFVHVHVGAHVQVEYYPTNGTGRITAVLS